MKRIKSSTVQKSSKDGAGGRAARCAHRWRRPCCPPLPLGSAARSCCFCSSWFVLNLSVRTTSKYYPSCKIFFSQKNLLVPRFLTKILVLVLLPTNDVKRIKKKKRESYRQSCPCRHPRPESPLLHTEQAFVSAAPGLAAPSVGSGAHPLCRSTPGTR